MTARIRYQGRDYWQAQPCPSRRLRAAVYAHEMRRYRLREHLSAWAQVSLFLAAVIVGVAFVAAYEMGLL